MRKNAVPVLYSYMGRKSCAAPLQLNGQRNDLPAHTEEVLYEVSTSMVLTESILVQLHSMYICQKLHYFEERWWICTIFYYWNKMEQCVTSSNIPFDMRLCCYEWWKHFLKLVLPKHTRAQFVRSTKVSISKLKAGISEPKSRNFQIPDLEFRTWIIPSLINCTYHKNLHNISFSKASM